jgi:hypothetical protein
MANFVRPMFGFVNTVIPHTVVASTAGTARTLSSTDYGENFNLTIHCTTGVVFLNPSTVATSANGFKIAEGQSLDLKVSTGLSLVGLTTTAGFQGLVWE